MAFSVPAAVAADANNIQIQLPAAGDRDWGTGVRDLCFVLLANHDHGSAGGQPISGASLGADSVDGVKILLDNDTYLRWENFAGSSTNVIKLAADDKVEIAPQVDLLVLSNTIAIQGRNAADSANINLAKIDAEDKIVIGESTVNHMILQKETLADNQTSSVVPNFAVLATTESAIVEYIITRGTASQIGKLIIDEDNNLLVEESVGDDVGVTFTNVVGQLKYATTSTGVTATIKLKTVRG